MPAFLRKFSLLAGLGGLIVILLDPFGLTSATDAASARLLNQLLANGYDEGARQRIAVVLIDDDYLRRRDSHWPLPYAEQSKLFRQLLAYRPAAVMVDLMYSYDHSQGRGNDSSQLLSNVFERYQDAAIPLYLASMGTADIPTLPELAAASQPASFGELERLSGPVSAGCGNKRRLDGQRRLRAVPRPLSPARLRPAAGNADTGRRRAADGAAMGAWPAGRAAPRKRHE